MSEATSRVRDPAMEALLAWAALIGALAILKAALSGIPYGGSITGACAVALFLLVPAEIARKLGRHEDDGLTWSHWREDLLFAVAVMLVVFPLFTCGFRGFLWVSDHFTNEQLAHRLTPYGRTGSFVWRLPPDLLNLVGGNIAVGVAEEFFYRGYMLRRFLERWPAGARVLGAPFGRAMLAQTSLFALGHLLSLNPWRLATFFPGLLFGWMAARSNRVVAPAIVHACSNILMATLEASAFGP